MLESRECVRYAEGKGFGIEDVVGLVLGGFVVNSGEKLFGELEFRHIGVVIFLQALGKAAERGSGCRQIEVGGGKWWGEVLEGSRRWPVVGFVDGGSGCRGRTAV